MGKKLFEEEEVADDAEEITIDEEFARRFEHNNRRADLHRLKELQKKGLVPESDTESESEVESSGDDEEFFDKLNKVKNRDPSIYHNKDALLFDSESDGDNLDKKKEKKMEADKGKGKAPAYLKDVLAQQLLEDGPRGRDDDIDHGHAGKDRRTYLKEQEELMRAFRDAEGESELDGDLFKEVESGTGRDKEGENGELEKKVGEYFGEGELDEKDRFLRDFFLHKMWEDKDGDRGVDEREVEAVIEDEYEVERQEQFEEALCYRHEENAGDRVMGHSRVVEGSVRKKDKPRKGQRLRREERMKIAETERKEEIKRLKNLKRQEIEERMRKIMDAAGIKSHSDCPLDLDLDNEDDFDLEEHHKKMSKAFDDKYYEAEDPEFGSGSDMEKPDFDKEDELLGLPDGLDVPGTGDDFSAARERILKMNAESEAKKVKEEMLEEYYKLDCEGTIGDLKTRFRYTKTEPNRYGMKPADILLLDDKELNQYVSMKKLAVYREKEWKLPNSKRHQLKMRVSELRRGLGNDQGMVDKKNKKKTTKMVPKAAETAAAAPPSEDERAKSDAVDQLTQGKRRRRRQEEFKISKTRRMAYAQAQPKPKNERKH